MDAALRQMRILHIAFLVSTVLYVVIGEQIPSRGETIRQDFYWSLAMLAFLCAASALVIRSKIAGAVESELRLQPSQAALLTRWRMGQILGIVLAEAAVLFGLVIRILGGTFAQTVVLYAIGIAALLLMVPRRL